MKIKTRKIALPFTIRKPVLALGGQTKNTVCSARQDAAEVSPVHADLNVPDDRAAFEREVNYFLNKDPRVIAYDLHPGYRSSQYALQHIRYSVSGIPVQHHHAHIASCMADNGTENKKVIGVAFDGTGFGDDATIWGAEFLLCDYQSYARKARLMEIPLLGGESAIRQPWRVGIAWLFTAYKEKFLTLPLALVKKLPPVRWRLLKRMYEKGLYAPRASSMGRIFDAAGSIITGSFQDFPEAALACAMERWAGEYREKTTGYDFLLSEEKGILQADPRPMWKQLVAAMKEKEPKERIAYRFHLGIARMTAQVCVALRKKTGTAMVALSGGVFQNNLLRTLVAELLYKERFRVLTHRNIPCHDAGISLGQAVVAAMRR